MFKSFRLFLLSFVLTSSLVFAPVTTVYAVSFPAEINKSFTPDAITSGDISKLRVSIYNPNSFQLTDAAWTDNLPAGITIASPLNVTQTCSGSVAAVAGEMQFSLSAGIVPPQVGSTPGTCYVEIDVTSTTSGNLINTIGFGPVNGLSAKGNDGGTIVDITNTTPASATLNVVGVQPASVSKSFTPNTIWIGQPSVLAITIRNNDPTTTLTQASLTDTMPANVVLANPAVGATPLTNCGAGTLNATSGNDFVTLNNASIAPNTTCTIRVNVTSSVQGNYLNSIPAGPGGLGSLQTLQGVTTAAVNNIPLAVQATTVTKSFNPTAFQTGDTSNLTVTLRNPTFANYTGAQFVDNLPANLTLTGVIVSNSCGGTVTATAGATDLSLNGGTIPPATAAPFAVGSCSVIVGVTSSVAAAYPNNIPIQTIATGPTTIVSPLPATATVTVTARSIGVVKAFSPTSFNPGGTSTLTITLQNRTSTAYTGVSFTDTMPANLTIVGTPTASAACGGPTLTGSDANNVVMTNGTIPAGTVATPGTCVITATVTSSTSGAYPNTILAGDVDATTPVGVTNLVDSNTATVTVNTTGGPATGTKTFNPTTIASGGNSRLRIDIFAPSDTNLTNFSIIDDLPAGVTVSNSTPPAISGCGALSAVLPAVWPPATGATSIRADGATGTILAGARCRIDIYVTSSTPGTVTNSILPANITNAQNRTIAAPLTANLTVTGFSMSKIFNPATVNANGFSTLTITLTNTSSLPLDNVSLSDTLPGNATNGVRVAPMPNANTTCTGGALPPTVTAVAGSGTITLANGFVPAQVLGVPGVCTITVDVQGKGVPAAYTNTILTTNVIGTLQGTGTSMRPIANASANLIVGNLTMEVVKKFDPQLVYGGSISTLSITLRNPNPSAALIGIAFTDTMPAGMILADPVSLNVGTCGGTLSGIPGANTFSYSGGSLPAATECKLTLKATLTVNGNLTNTIPIGAVTTFNGVSNTTATSASLTNLAGAGITKGFAPNPIIAGSGDYSLLTITIKNTTTLDLTQMGLVDTLPAGLEIAAAPASINNCSGSLDAVAGTQNIELTNGNLSGNSSCTLLIPVIGAAPGVFTNTILPNTLTTLEGRTNIDPAVATLTLTGFSLGNRVWDDNGAGGGTASDGVRNGTEPGIDGVTVNLYRDSNDDGTPDGASIANTSTAGGGFYRFDNLAAGTYIVEVVPPTGYASTVDAGDPDTDVDDDDDNGVVVSGSNIRSNPVTLGPGASEPIGENNPLTNPEAGEAVDDQSNRTVDFGFISVVAGGIFDPPTAIKTFSEAGLPQLEFRMVWINSSNTFAIDVQVTDNIPTGTTYVPGSLTCVPSGSSSNAADAVSPLSLTAVPNSFCGFDAGNNRIQWQGNIGPDDGNLTEAAAANEVVITFRVTVNNGVNQVLNQGFSRTDVDDDGNFDEETVLGTSVVSSNQVIWNRVPSGGDDGDQNDPVAKLPYLLPVTGFAPGVKTVLPEQPLSKAYAATNVQLEIPSLGLSLPIVGVPLVDNDWDVSWLDKQVGWLNGTAFPTWKGNSALTGHVTLSDGKPGPFANLDNLKWGDKVLVYAYGYVYEYQVRENKTIAPNDTSVLKHEKDSWLTLITCKNYDEATGTYLNRVAVRAILISVEKEQTITSSGWAK